MAPLLLVPGSCVRLMAGISWFLDAGNSIEALFGLRIFSDFLTTWKLITYQVGRSIQWLSRLLTKQYDFKLNGDRL